MDQIVPLFSSYTEAKQPKQHLWFDDDRHNDIEYLGLAEKVGNVPGIRRQAEDALGSSTPHSPTFHRKLEYILDLHGQRGIMER